MLGTAAARPLQREWSRSREPTTRSTPRFVMPQQPSFPLPQAQRRPPVAKTVTTGPVLVFVAGVEGTGHHMLCAALTPRHPHCRTEPCFKVDKRLDALTRALVFTPSGAWRGGRAAVIERLRGYHQPLNGLANASHRRMMMQCTDTPGSGLGSKLSYPDDTLSLERDSEKEGKATAHADVALLAELAEEAGVDLRVVTLTRELASTARSRMQPNATGAAARTALAAIDRWRTEPARNSNGGGASLEAARWRAALRWPPGGSLSRRPFESQARILADQECLLASQLRQLDRRFYHVLPYEAVLRSPRQLGLQLARFLRMEATAEQLATSFGRTVRPSRRAPPSADERAYASSLQLQACDPQTIWDTSRVGMRVGPPGRAVEPRADAESAWMGASHQ